jgi:hypothetical protein
MVLGRDGLIRLITLQMRQENNMAYKPKNVANLRVGKDAGRGGDGTYPGVVPGSTGSDDRESQLRDFLGDGDHTNPNEQGGSDYSLLGTDNLDSRKKGNFGSASYNYKQPTL